ncbi:alpha/beta hydrolase [Nocardioides sp. Soil777]|uniref:alpha/beta hydrolase n=1 Tax=Nocardioides sp. Soil777 TaxID=1736409 RepID=UPI0009EA470C|nr:alpha/beta-hydrolase family protein [Nocardioides sp. Soil777]
MPRTGTRRFGVGDYTLPGLWVALVLACLSFTPSLLPRPAAFQGAVVGIDAALGYGLGVLGAFVWREFADRGPRELSERARRVWRVVAVLALVGATLVGRRWHVQASRIVDAEPESAWATLLVPLVGGAVFVLLVALGRAIGNLYGRVSTWLARRMGERAARATGLLALVSVTVLLASGVLWDASMRFADRVYATLDGSTPDGATQPSTGLRSGGPGSLVEWDSLGREGRSFTGRGPTSAEISAFHDGEPALDPIRIYAGLSSADDTEQRADLAVRDLWRAGGFERESLLVVTATGTGWVEPSAAGSFEYLTRGDSAVVSMQYSHLPSWLSFLVDQEKAREAGRGLFDAVYERWSRMPPEERPRLFVFGESLGSFGGETAFSGEFDLRNRLDGALFVGPPNFNPLYRDFVEGRDPGSKEVEPVYRAGRTIRFTTLPARSIEPQSAWPGTRVLYMQHASDPVTWWSPDLILSKPDWLDEPRGRDVLEDTRWIPLVTFWQVSVDLALGFSTTPGHGHNFSGEHVDGWAAVLGIDDLGEDDAEALRQVFRREQ